MAASTTFWKRMTTALRDVASGRWFEWRADLPDVSASDGMDRPQPVESANASHAATWRSWLPTGRMAQLHAQQRQIAAEVGALRERIAELDRRTERLVASAEWIASTLDQVRAGQQTQADHVAALTRPVEAVNKQVGALAAATHELPAKLETCVQTMRTVAATVTESGQASRRMEEAVQRCLAAVETLQNTWNEGIRWWRQADAAREQALQQHLDRQVRRLTLVSVWIMLAGVAVVVAVAAAARVWAG